MKKPTKSYIWRRQEFQKTKHMVIVLVSVVPEKGGK